MSSRETQEALEIIRRIFGEMNATQVADLWVSPHVEADLFRAATAESGPTLWVVNRSDVYDRSLEILATHELPEIAARAKEKMRKRRGDSLEFLDPPEADGPLEQVPDYAVEDVLGHPLCSFEAMLFFSQDISEDHRASSALSLTRRLLEHPPNWALHLDLKFQLIDRFGRMLLEDPSPYARAYAARVPLLPDSVFEAAWKTEEHPLVKGRLLQNPATPTSVLASLASSTTELSPPADIADLDWFALRVAAFDARLDPDQRRALHRLCAPDPLSSATHAWFLTQN